MSTLATKSKPFRYAQFKALNKRNYPAKGLHEPSSSSNSIAASCKWLAAGYGAKGGVIVLPIKSKNFKRSDNPPTISAHGGEIADLQFSPFNDDVLATSGRDGTVKLWSVPEKGLTENVSTPAATISEFEGGANSIRFHPSAEGVLAAGGKNKLSIIDVAKGSEKQTFRPAGAGQDVISLAWNYDGSLLSSLAKNGTVAVLDPRSAAENVLGTGAKLATITRPQHTLFIGKDNKGYLSVIGLDKSQRPGINFYDTRDLTKPTLTQSLDLSNGFTLPLYDVDTELLMLTVRGSQALQVFDVALGKTGPTWFGTTQFGCDTGFKGACLQPKRVSSFANQEVNRVFLMGTDVIQPYSMRVPRKNRGFHAELYPDTADGKAALAAETYFEGKNADPLLTGLEKIAFDKGCGAASATEEKKPAPVSVEVKEEKKVLRASSDEAARAATSPTAAEGAGTPTAGTPTGRLSISQTRASIDQKLARSTYQHLAGTEPNSKDLSWFDLHTSDSLMNCFNIAANSKFLAVPWKTTGGSAVAVLRTDKPGRVTQTTPCLRGHKQQVTSIDLSAFDPHLLATGAADGSVKVWRLPETGLTADATEAAINMQTDGKVQLVRFHPQVADCLVTALHGSDGGMIQFWDLKEAKSEGKGAAEIKAPKLEFKGFHPDPITDMAFESNGALIATTDRGKRVRVFNPRTGRITAEFAPFEGERDTRVLFYNTGRVIVSGFGQGGRRSFSLWDLSKTDKALCQTELLTNNNIIIPHYDSDTGVLFIANNGSSLIQMYALTQTAPYVEELGVFKSQSDVTGHVFMHKTACDVKAVEVNRSYKLSKDKILPVSWKVPRKRLEFFQDDLFPPTRALKPVYSAAEWFERQDKEPEFISLCPAGMTELSKAPKEELTDRQVRRQQFIQAQDAPKAKGILGHSSAEEVRQHFLGIAKDGVSSNRWDAKQSKINEVADEEWDA